MIIKRFKDNPVLTPDDNHFWESRAVFNGCPVVNGKKISLVYRAVSSPHYHTPAGKKLMLSSIGVADSFDGLRFTKRRQLIIPELSWERFGCEDPRVTRVDDKYFIFYTALSDYPFTADGIKVGVALSDDLKSITEKHLVTPFNAKAMALFPERIDGKLWVVFSMHTDMPPAKICLASFSKESDLWSEDYWRKWYVDSESFILNLKRSDKDHVEVGAPPVKTKHGWLLFYSYIKNYFSSNKLFTVEAVLLDLNNPLKIIARTENPLLTPNEYYERIGVVPNIVFPSGALIDGDRINLYYGGADTACCLAFINKPKLLNYMLGAVPRAFFKRRRKTPLLTPVKEHSWEAKAVFNPAAIYLKGKVHLLYRAMSFDNTSVIGYASSIDGVSINYRSDNPVYVPRKSFEMKLVSGGNSGCEDPRIVKIGNVIYMFYTAFDSKNPPRVALTSINVNDFINQQWNWSEPKLITPPNIDDKDACVFPEKIKGGYYIIHRSGDDMDLAFRKSLVFKDDDWIEEMHWIGPRRGWWDSRKIGLSAPPIKTKKGWLILYHGVSDDSVYRVGAVLTTIDDPFNIIGRTDKPVFEPEVSFEKDGFVPNVVFPCGAVVIGDELFLYYGGADKVVGVSSVKLSDLLNLLTN